MPQQFDMPKIIMEEKDIKLLDIAALMTIQFMEILPLVQFWEVAPVVSFSNIFNDKIILKI